MAEFKKEGKDPQDLIDAIHKNKPEIDIAASGPIQWLNELLRQGISGLPLKYDIKDTPETKEARGAFEDAADDDKPQELIKLNRSILEQVYSSKCPKSQVDESKPKPRRSKSPDSGMNLN